MVRRNLRPTLVLKQKDMTPSQQPASNRALWVIAISMAVIAICLVRMAFDRDGDSGAKVPEHSTYNPPKGTPMQPSAAQPFHNDRSKPSRRSSPPPTPIIAPAMAEDIARVPQSAAPSVAAIEPPRSTGLAPLAEVKTADGVSIISGRVILKGTPPRENKLAVSDSWCGFKKNTELFTRHFVVSTNSGLANVLVRIRSGLEGRYFTVPAAATLDQTNCQFQPYVIAVMKDQVLRIHNSDKEPHNVVSVRSGNRNPMFNINEGPGKTVEERFHSPEIPIPIMCSTQPWMRAYVCVADNPFFAVTDADGNFSITNAPPGDYVLEAYHVISHENEHGVLQPISVTTGATVTANFTIELPDKFVTRK